MQQDQQDRLDPLALKAILERLVLPEIQDPQVRQVALDLVELLDRQVRRAQPGQREQHPQ